VHPKIGDEHIFLGFNRGLYTSKEKRHPPDGKAESYMNTLLINISECSSMLFFLPNAAIIPKREIICRYDLDSETLPDPLDKRINSSEFAVFVFLQTYHLYFFAVGRESETHPAFDNWVRLNFCGNIFALLFQAARSFSRSGCRNFDGNS